MGELRERRRLTLPVAAGFFGMVVPVSIFLLFNAGHSSAHGWGVAMSTDTAFALAMLALVGRRFPDRLRAFLLTVSVVDDVLALCVIALCTASNAVDAFRCLGFFAVILVVRAAGVRAGAVYFLLGSAARLRWGESGVDPVVVGLALGLLTFAYPAARGDLERATDLFRLFREQPTAQLARDAQIGLRAAVSPNFRLQRVWQPWTSYAIVPLFALANAGIHVDSAFLTSAYGSPITLGIIFGYLVGKPVGVVGGSLLVTKLSGGRLRPPVAGRPSRVVAQSPASASPSRC
jgi:Na+/H+ antiporter NhaA